MKFANPRQTLEINDYPIGGSNRGQCKFEIEHNPKRGYRIVRTTTNKHGQWCKPKTSTYGGRAVIVSGEDGKTYILQMAGVYDFIIVWKHDLMQAECVHKSDGERHAELLALILAG